MSTKPSSKRGQSRQWPVIKEVTHNNGRRAWRVDGRIKTPGSKATTGKRYFFLSKADAETKAQLLRVERRNGGNASLTIPDALRVEALDCAERLKPFGKTLSDAVAFFLPHLERLSAGKAVRDAAVEILAEKVAEVKPATLKPYRTRVNRFAAAFGDRNLATITGEEIKRWLDATFPDAVTRANTRRVLVNFFNIAQAKKFTGSNPAAETRVRKEAAREIGILTPVEVGALLEHSTTDILPYFCIGAFAGIRPEELQRLEWSDFRWKQGILRIRAEVSKVGAARNVRIEPNLSAWLAPYRLSSGRICPAGWREQFRATRAAAGIGTWPHDCLRHSFATYWLEKHKDAPALALEMGNSVEVILRHYSKVLGKR